MKAKRVPNWVINLIAYTGMFVLVAWAIWAAICWFGDIKIY